jgi:hypothetical protein
MCTPSTSSLSTSAMSFTRPAVCCMPFARPFAANEKVPTLYGRPVFLTSSSVWPTQAISGAV